MIKNGNAFVNCMIRRTKLYLAFSLLFFEIILQFNIKIYALYKFISKFISLLNNINNYLVDSISLNKIIFITIMFWQLKLEMLLILLLNILF